jgi:hypothetical protein
MELGEYEPIAAVWYVVTLPRLSDDVVVSSVAENRLLDVNSPLDRVDNLGLILPSSSPCSEVGLMGDILNNRSARLERLLGLLGGLLPALS